MAKESLQLTTLTPLSPKCSHFGICGGCRFQQIPYSEQTAQKQHFIQKIFQKEPLEIVSSATPWRYRNKMEFTFSEAKDGKKFLGLIQKGTRGKVVQLEECFLTHNWFLDTLKKVYLWWQGSSLKAYKPFENRGTLRNLTLREGVHTLERMIVLTISGSEYGEIIPFLEEFKTLFEDAEAIILRKQFVQKGTPTYFEEEILCGRGFIYECLHDAKGKKWKFKIRASSFFQPNTKQAELLLQEAVKHIVGEIVFDLYCGTGTVGIFASNHAKKVIGIEIGPSSVEDAKDNLKENGVQNMEVHLGDVEKVLETISEIPDTVIVDPPRAGLSLKTIAILQKLKPKKIIYISCNPLTQQENCQLLGYKILSLQPVDQFPHTPHIENIAILVPE